MPVTRGTALTSFPRWRRKDIHETFGFCATAPAEAPTVCLIFHSDMNTLCLLSKDKGMAFMHSLVCI